MDRSSYDDARFEVTDASIKSESAAPSPRASTIEPPPSSFKSSTPIPSTETADSALPSSSVPKKKGTASTIKKKPKRPASGQPKKAKRPKSDADASTPGASGDEESDNGPYCLCRGPDDHRWMICCEKCDDWFHGECINLNKEVGENLIEKFICPRCTNKYVTSIYKKSCGLPNCRKAARLSQTPSSVFCSNEHAQTWWERMVSRLPKKGKAGLTDQLSQDEFMAMLAGGMATVDEDGTWRLAKAPFFGTMTNGTGKNTHHPSTLSRANRANSVKDGSEPPELSEEEKAYIDTAANTRLQLEAETVLCHKMLTLIELAQDRRRAAISAGKFGDDNICGYDQRLDTISARDAFAAYTKSPEGQTAFETSKLEDPLGEGDATRGMCERKRCKTHSGWQKALALGIRHQIREIAAEVEEVGEEETLIREAAAERWQRKRSEKNWVEVLDG